MSESGVIFDIKRFAIHDGPGIRTTVFFQGCPLDCPWCHNPEGKNRVSCRDLQQNRNLRDCNKGCRTVSAAGLLEEVSGDRIFFEQSNGGVTLSGGEPMLQPEFVERFLVLCRAEGIPAILDTSGFCEYTYIERVAGLVDRLFYDLKLADDRAHVKYTGVSNEPVMQNLRKLDSAGAFIVPRVALIPGITNTEENIMSIAELLSSLNNIDKVGIIPFNPMCIDKLRRYRMKNNLEDLPASRGIDIEEASRIFAEYGFIVEREE